MEELYSTLLPHGRVHCMTWSGTNLVAVSLSEEIPDSVTEDNERCLSLSSYPHGSSSVCVQDESELSRRFRPRQAVDLSQVRWCGVSVLYRDTCSHSPFPRSQSD